jgi:ceramide glucosyltransferase
MSALTLLFSLIWIVSLGLLLAGVLYSLSKIRKSNGPFTDPTEQIAISILKPLCGLDEGLEANLESFFQLDYPKFELLFSLANSNDPARPLVEKLIRQYPNVHACLRVSDTQIGKNPKINNVYLDYKTCRYPLVLISDSNIRVEPDYLKSMVSLLKNDVGVVTSAISGVGATSLGAAIEAIYLNTYLFRWIHLSNKLGKPIVMGKSMLFRKQDIARCGDIEALANLIAEDYGTIAMMKTLGLKIAVMNQPVDQYLGAFSLKSFWGRHIRWGRIRKACEYKLFLAEPLSSALVSGMVGGLAFHRLMGLGVFPFLGLHLSLWFAVESLLAIKTGSAISFKTFYSWFLLELLALPFWLYSLCGNTIQWRGNKLKLFKGGRL